MLSPISTRKRRGVFAMFVVMVMRAVVGVLLGVRVAPEHQLFEDEERTDAGNQARCQCRARYRSLARLHCLQASSASNAAPSRVPVAKLTRCGSTRPRGPSGMSRNTPANMTLEQSA